MSEQSTIKAMPVHGYRDQSQQSVDLVNQNKQAEERILRMIDDMKNNPQVDGRWLAIGKTEVELAFMALNRAVFNPSRSALPEDDDCC